MCDAFRTEFCKNIALSHAVNVDEYWTHIRDACKTAASCCLPLIRAMRKRPWISDAILKLIDLRDEARGCHDYATEVFYNKKIRRSSVLDRASWLNRLINDGSWDQLKRLRSKPFKSIGRLRNMNGDVVASNEKAHALADHFEMYIMGM